MNANYNSKINKNNFWLISASSIFFILAIFFFFEMKNMNDISNRSFDFLMALIFSGILMLFIFLKTIKNLHKEYNKTGRLNHIANVRMNAIEASREGIAILDDNGNFIYMNDAHSYCYGYKNKDELIGKSWRVLYSPKEQINVESIIINEVNSMGWWAGHSVGRMKDGNEFAQEISLTKLSDGGFVCIVKDISQYIKKENTMQVIKIAIDKASDGIFIMDKDNKFMFLNSSFMDLHGFSVTKKSSFVGADWRMIYGKDEQEFINSKVLPKTIMKGSWEGYMDITKKNGENFYADTSLTKLPNGLILGVIRDATERKKILEQKEKLKEQMYESQKLETISRVIKGIGSDFKSSISVIRKNLDLAISYEDVPEERKKYMAEMLVATDNANNMIDQLLSLSEGRNVNAKNVDVIDIILRTNNNIVKTLKNNISIKMDVKIDHGHVFCDEEQLKKCLIGICENAADSISKDEGIISIVVAKSENNYLPIQKNLEEDRGENNQIPKIYNVNNKFFVACGTLEIQQKYIRISVSDNGEGIPFDFLPNVFDPFFSTKIGVPSSNLGLSAIKSFVLSSKGVMAIESAVGEGTSIHMFLPICAEMNVYGEMKISA